MSGKGGLFAPAEKNMKKEINKFMHKYFHFEKVSRAMKRDMATTQNECPLIPSWCIRDSPKGSVHTDSLIFLKWMSEKRCQNVCVVNGGGGGVWKVRREM